MMLGMIHYCFFYANDTLVGGFGTFFIFHSLGIITPTDFHIFSEGQGSTTNQYQLSPMFVCFFQRYADPPLRVAPFALRLFPPGRDKNPVPCWRAKGRRTAVILLSSSWSYRHHHKPISGWRFGTWFLWLSIHWECHHPNWLIFFRGVETTNQLSKIALSTILDK